MRSHPERRYRRIVLIVLDSVGIGEAPDAWRFGDAGANTLRHVAAWCRERGHTFALPNLARWGLGDLVEAHGVARDPRPVASRAVLEETSAGKDTTTGHWEIAGTPLERPFPTFPDGFPEDLLLKWCAEVRLAGWLGNRPASGTEILDELGEDHLSTGLPIVYTSADSVFQVACSEEAFGLERLYAACGAARRLLDPLGVARVIARPFTGRRRGEFRRTANRRDFSLPPPEPNMLDVLHSRGMFVAAIGKIEDIFAGRSIDIVQHTDSNADGIGATLELTRETSNRQGLIFTNLVDFDQIYGHRRDPHGYAGALMEFDRSMPRLEASLSEDDLLIVTADHGNDPTHPGTDHTRERVPLLFWSPGEVHAPRNMGILRGFGTVARVVLESLGLDEAVALLPGARVCPRLEPTAR